MSENQVQPFRLNTSDGEVLNAWHVLPLSVYTRNEDVLLNQPSGLSKDMMQSPAFKLLFTDPQSRLVINC